MTLRIVARFGEVVIPEPQEHGHRVDPRRAPDVTLEGAPKRIVLAGEEDASEIPIHYEATDDHGLREVHLVLRSGAREERRVLARLDGETRSDRGGYNLRASDPFIKQSHAPIEVRVEAKDNDPDHGPEVGRERRHHRRSARRRRARGPRLAALRALRDALVDTLAWRLGHRVPKELKDRREFLDRGEVRGRRAPSCSRRRSSTSYAGVRVPGRLAALLRGRSGR